MPDQFAGQVVERAVDGLLDSIITGDFPALGHGIGRAGVAKCVVGADGTVEATVPAIFKAPAVVYLAGEVAAAGVNHVVAGRLIQLVDYASTSIAPRSVEQLWWCIAVDKESLGTEQGDLGLVFKVEWCAFSKAQCGVVAEFFPVDHHMGNFIAAVEHGVAIQFLLKKGRFPLAVQSQAMAKVAPFGHPEAFPKGLPVQTLAVGYPIDTQPAGIQLRALEQFAYLGGQLQPQRIQVFGAAMADSGPLLAITHRKKQGVRRRKLGQFPLNGWTRAQKEVGEGIGFSHGAESFLKLVIVRGREGCS